MDALTRAINRSVKRTEAIIGAIDSGDLAAVQAVNTLAAALPWELDSIGKAAMVDHLASEKTADDDLGEN